MFSNIIVAVAALVVADPANAAVEAAASEWVDFVDKQKRVDSWNSAGALSRSQRTSMQWTSAVHPVRTPLGVVHSRKLEKITATKSLPGAPNGEYRIVEFRTTFANKADALETVILARETSGWAVNGYFIR